MAPRSELIHKAFAYIVRIVDDRPQLLAFVCDDDERGYQVPKGSVEPEETPEEGVLREVLEESGLRDVEIVRKLGTTRWTGRGGPTMQGPIEEQKHHFFLIRSLVDLPDSWDHLVASDGIDNGLIYRYSWLDIDETTAELFVQGSGAFVLGCLVSGV